MQTYNARVKTWDVVIIGAGIIGLSLAISLRKHGLRVLVADRGEPGREASSAAAGMLVGSGTELPAVLLTLAEESARTYPEFVHELEDESGLKVDLRDQGTILLGNETEFPRESQLVGAEKLSSLEPGIIGAGTQKLAAAYLRERSVDPRQLVSAALKAVRHRGVDISSGSHVEELLFEGESITGVRTAQTSYASAIVVNCMGAWAGAIGAHRFPVRPVKGQMLAMVGGPKLEHVIRAPEVYLVPRTEGRIVIGSTLEDAGFNKQTDVGTIENLFRAAVELVPALAGSRRHDDWAGLRPGTPDNLPLIGRGELPNVIWATGHYRNGVLLTPITAEAVAELLTGGEPPAAVRPFTPERFGVGVR